MCMSNFTNKYGYKQNERKKKAPIMVLFPMKCFNLIYFPFFVQIELFVELSCNHLNVFGI